MNKIRKIILLIYAVLVIIFGVIVVPVKSVWGPSRTLDTCKYTAIWDTIDKYHNINGYNPVNELDLQRMFVTFVVITIVSIVFYMVFGDKK